MTAIDGSNLDDQLNRLQADGKINDHDAEEVRRFGDFLQDLAAAGIKTSRSTDKRRAAQLYFEHYPEHAPAGDDQ